VKKLKMLSKKAKIYLISFASFRYCEKDAKRSENLRKILLFVSQKEAKNHAKRFVFLFHFACKRIKNLVNSKVI
jgi:hypothetical protein